MSLALQYIRYCDSGHPVKLGIVAAGLPNWRMKQPSGLATAAVSFWPKSPDQKRHYMQRLEQTILGVTRGRLGQTIHLCDCICGLSHWWRSQVVTLLTSQLLSGQTHQFNTFFFSCTLMFFPQHILSKNAPSYITECHPGG